MGHAVSDMLTLDLTPRSLSDGAVSDVVIRPRLAAVRHSLGMLRPQLIPLALGLSTPPDLFFLENSNGIC